MKGGKNKIFESLRFQFIKHHDKFNLENSRCFWIINKSKNLQGVVLENTMKIDKANKFGWDLTRPNGGLVGYEDLIEIDAKSLNNKLW